MSIEDVKGKFNKLQGEVQGLSNKKIATESEINTLSNDLQERVKALLELTGKGSLQEAADYYKEQKEFVDTRSGELSQKLDTYLQNVKG